MRQRHDRFGGQGPPARPERSYANLHDATLARVASLRAYPGNQSLSWHAAKALVTRGTAAATTGAAPGAVQFCHDPRLREASPAYLSDEQVVAFLSATKCPVLAVTGTRGWPWPGDTVRARPDLARALQEV